MTARKMNIMEKLAGGKLLAIVLIFIPLGFSCQSKINSQTREFIPPQTAMEKFYGFEGKEKELMDPLILAGEPVVPLVIEAIKNQEMPKRRYAIGFLGNGEYKQALPVLEEILKNPDEKDYFRGDALLAIYQVDKELGIKYAKEQEQSKNPVGEIAKDILSNASYINERRSYPDALKNYPNL